MRVQGLPRPVCSTVLPGRGPSFRPQSPSPQGLEAVRNPAGPSLGGGREWGEAPWAHELLEVAWPQSPLELKGWGTGVEDTNVPVSLSLDP